MTISGKRLTAILTIYFFLANLSLPVEMARSTDQVWTKATFNGANHIALEHPMYGYWGAGLSLTPTFDFRSTANYLGFETQWEVVGDKLMLTVFEATIDGRTVTADRIFGRNRAKFPILADWYTGKLHLLYAPRVTTPFQSSIVNQTFREVIICTVRRGVIESMEERSDFHVTPPIFLEQMLSGEFDQRLTPEFLRWDEYQQLDTKVHGIQSTPGASGL